ncbi:LysM peptidoglycan-binding domain-containing protein [Thermoactinomyces mirandus]|uniref:LysM peptidoglycan-binding domain-containing protein n=1 Tax=Thermoactinomyces mirandus TaxID=2756294 RepID=A0A7W1XPD2_9BACL|nr:LysM domain-containing protein [Thermoactinomyces mirandus]MBA4600823.1 LysM peptidoglycan-binding domain-containing protein [Thermoactinomyces mirandus]
MKIHIVRSGETLSDIAQKYNITLERLQELNPDLSKSEMLNAGEKVRVPTGKIALAVEKREESTDPDEEVRYKEYEGYPKENEKNSDAEPLSNQLPKPPSIEELTNWSEMMDSSSILDYSSFDYSSVYENLDTSDTLYLETPPEPYPRFRQESGMLPVPPFLNLSCYPMVQGWGPAPCYVPPIPISNPYINLSYPHPAVSGPENGFAVEHREWKESSSSEG